MRQRGEAPGARPAPGHPAGTVPAATPWKPGGCPPCLQNSLFLLFCLLKFQNSKRLDPEGLLLFKVCLHHSPGSRRSARDNGHSVWKQCLVQTPGSGASPSGYGPVTWKTRAACFREGSHGPPRAAPSTWPSGSPQPGPPAPRRNSSKWLSPAAG